MVTIDRQGETKSKPHLRLRTPLSWELVEALRGYRAAGFVPRVLIKIADDAGYKVHLTQRALLDFLNGDTANLKEPSRAALAGYWIESGQGQALLSLRTATASPFVKVVGSLSAGFKLCPAGLDATGTYYLYYGAYMWPEHFIIRAMSVQAVAGQLLTVEDYVRDLIHRANYGEILTASGVMTFEETCPQILLRSDRGENKLGLSMILSNPIGSVGKKLMGFTGALLVLPDQGSVAARRCMFVRDETEDLEAMKLQSGIFPISRVNAPEPALGSVDSSGKKIEPIAEKHKERVRTLAEEQFPVDPILWLAPWWKDKGSLKQRPTGADATL